MAVVGMSIVFDPPGYVPPKGFMPDAIQCRRCGWIYADKDMPKDSQDALLKGGSDVR